MPVGRPIVSEVWNYLFPTCEGRGRKAQIAKRAKRILRTFAIGSFRDLGAES